MVSSEVEARLRFLERASEALAVTAPTVSSFMRASKREAAFYHESEPTGSGDVCDGCGQLIAIGWSCETVRTGVLVARPPPLNVCSALLAAPRIQFSTTRGAEQLHQNHRARSKWLVRKLLYLQNNPYGHHCQSRHQ
jgi:hypothetical protein